MAGRALLGVDCGTTFVKSVAFDLDGNELAVARGEIPALSPRPEWSEVHLDALWDATAATIRQVAAQVGAESIAAVGISGTGSGVWPIDAAGRPTRNGIIWNDGRAGDIVSAWRDQGLLEEMFARSGCAPYPGFLLPCLRWLADHEPQVLERTRWLLFQKDWLRFNLTGDVHTEPSDVSLAPGDARARGYSEALFRLCGVQRYWDRLPPLARSDEVVGEVSPAAAARVGLRAGTPVVTGLLDVAAGAIGGGVVRVGQACTILGTGVQNAVVVAQPSFLPPDSGVQVSLPGGAWLRSLVTRSGTMTLDWLREHLAAPERARAATSGESVFALVEAAIQEVPPGARGVLFLPFLNPSGIVSPFSEPAARALFFGIAREHTRADLMRAVYEGVALAVRDCYQQIGQPVEQIVLVGGGARSELWAQMFADATEREVLVPSGAEVGARGVALLAGVGAGLYPSLEAAVSSSVRIGRQYRPRPAPARAYRALYELYSHLQLNLRDAWRLRRRLLTGLEQPWPDPDEAPRG